LGFVDSNGNWATSLHENLTLVALSGLLSAGQLRTINQQHHAMDQASFQGNSPTFDHAMLDKGQGQDVGQRLMGNSIQINLRLATGLGTSAALKSFGRALHTIQDFYSPAHTTDSGQLLEWSGYSGDLAHRFREDSFADSWFRFGQAAKATLRAFIQVDPVGAMNAGLTPVTLEAILRRRVGDALDVYFLGSSATVAEREAALLCALGTSAACVN
jgi:hypothetical protein